MSNAKVIWARKEIGKRLRKAKSVKERRSVFKKVWTEAHKKFGR